MKKPLVLFGLFGALHVWFLASFIPLAQNNITLARYAFITNHSTVALILLPTLATAYLLFSNIVHLEFFLTTSEQESVANTKKALSVFRKSLLLVGLLFFLQLIQAV